MRKNTLLSIAQVIIKFTRIMIVISFALLLISAIGTLINPEWSNSLGVDNITLKFSGDGNSSLGSLLQASSFAFFYNVLNVLMQLTLVFLLLSQLLKVINSISSLKTFIGQNVSSFKRIGYMLVILFFLRMFGFNVTDSGVSTVNFSFDLAPLVGALIAFILMEIFKEGNKLREDSQLTI